MLLRPAEPGDAEILLAWRNDPLTRAMSRQQDEVARADHLAWFERALADPRRIILIGTEQGRSVGMVRFDLGSPCEVSINLDPAVRGRGLSRTLLALALQGFASRPIEAEIREENLASHRLFEGAGFQRITDRDGLRRYRLD